MAESAQYMDYVPWSAAEQDGCPISNYWQMGVPVAVPYLKGIDEAVYQVEKSLAEEAQAELCMARIAEKSYEPAREMSPRKPNVSSVHSIEVIPRLDSTPQPRIDPTPQPRLDPTPQMPENRQSMISPSKLNPDASEFIPRGRTAIANFLAAYSRILPGL